MKRIVHIIHCGTGGTGRLFLQLQEQDLQNEHLALAWGTEPLSPLLQNESGIVYISKRAGVDMFAWLRLLQELHTLKPDTVVLHSATAYPSVRIARMLRKMHWIAVEHTHPDLQSESEQKAMQAIARTCDTLIVFSEKRAAAWRIRFPNISIAVIPHAIDTHFWAPASTEPAPAPFQIGVHGRVIPWKQLHLLIEAIGILRDRPIELHIAGIGAALPQLKALVESLHVQTKVHFHGELSSGEVLRFLHSLHAWMLPSKGESMGLAAMEALACGLPLALSGHTELQHLYPNLSDASAEAWAQAILELCENYPEKRKHALQLRVHLEAQSLQWIQKWKSLW